ncbi:MAG TPA: PLP-dependent aminotransferase family protein [Gemmatimonadaceae bacterium]|nr:PLP-dependent aminotransferase family protein [Gemmatimonadaceae bacterium]
MPRTRNTELTIALDPANQLPLYLQIARAIAGDIRRGRLRPGDALPGSRTLARSLAVHRNTVIAAYTELVVEGWIATAVAGGTFVATKPPDAARRNRATAPTCSVPSAHPGYPLGAPLAGDRPPGYRPGLLLLARGLPDVRLLPTIEIARAYRRVLARSGRELLTYGDPQGHPRLRAAITAMLAAARGIVTSPDRVLITRGSQMALDLTARALFAPGDTVAVEELGQRATWNVFQLAGATLLPIPVDKDGLRVDALLAAAERQPIRAVYVTPHSQFPTTVVLSPERRAALLAFAAERGVAIIEDDYDHEFRYDGRPLLPLASHDTAGVVIYIGTLSKILAPGLRIGFVIAPSAVVDRLTSLRVAGDLQGDLAVECAVADLFESGELGRHVRRMLRTYRARRDALAAALRRDLPTAVDFAMPSGGMALWARVRDGIDIDEWSHHALSLGVSFRGGQPYHFSNDCIPFARLGFSFHDEGELEEAVRRMARALERVSRRTTLGH